MRIPFALALALASAAGASAAAQTVIPTAPFRSVTLRGGGEVVLRHGPAQRVAVLDGDASTARIAVNGGRLRIENCHLDCKGRRRLRLEITTPSISGVSVGDGGMVRAVGAFPAQRSLGAAVSQGGGVDLRALPAAHVAAAVDSGGRILVRPGETLSASVRHGGIVAYWGKPRVTRAIQGGGVVAEGSEADVALMGHPIAPVPPVAPVPPRPPH
jgi:hypothetical protein